jgi:hypothetical protein
MFAQNDNLYYAELEAGALYLAEQAEDAADRSRHLVMAARYHMQALGEPYPPFRGRH